MRLTPVLGGMTPEQRETPESLFPSRDGSSRMTARVSHAPVAPIMITLFFSRLFAIRIYYLCLRSIFNLLISLMCFIAFVRNVFSFPDCE